MGYFNKYHCCIRPKFPQLRMKDLPMMLYSINISILGPDNFQKSLPASTSLWFWDKPSFLTNWMLEKRILSRMVEFYAQVTERRRLKPEDFMPKLWPLRCAKGKQKLTNSPGVILEKTLDFANPTNMTWWVCSDTGSITQAWQRKILLVHQRSMVFSSLFQRARLVLN